MTNKRKIEILEEVIHLLKKDKYNLYICNRLRNCARIGEETEILKWFKSKKPSKVQYTNFTKSRFWWGEFSWWKYGAKSQRIKFLNVLIKELHDESKED